MNIDFKCAAMLREKVNEYINYFQNETSNLVKKGNKNDNTAKNIWEKTCAIMDRIDDTIWYLNKVLDQLKSKNML